MNILIISSLLLAAILLLQYFVTTKKGVRSIVIFGITVGLSIVVLNHIFDSCFGASTPVDIITKNVTGKNLRIYALVFWDDYGNGSGNYTNYDTKLKPGESSDFCIDNDGGKFWLVAKDDNDEIAYLEEFSNNKSQYNFIIKTYKNLEQDKALIAKELTINADKSVQLNSYLIWTNLILIGLLTYKLFKN